ncbi:MAG TPA: glycosyltransferase family 9 protein [Candidatus Dormibacteraeota bacterium]|nr:glycosyltransferase family 9 protein [Candidatus Dormibacteraeota bacterium]
MIPADARVRLEVGRPADRMLPDRLRRAARLVYLVARAFLLLSLGVLRGRERRPPAPSRVARILVVRADRIGDMALTTPALMDLRDHFRKAEITVLAPPAPLSLLEAHPAVDRRVPLTGRRLPVDLAGRFDLAIDFTADEDLRAALVTRATRARFRGGFRAAGRQVCFSLRGPRADARRHVLDLNRDLLETLGVPAGTVHPGGHYPTQRWSPECFAELITLLTGRTGAACVVIAGPAEQDLCLRVCAATPDALTPGPTSVREMMALVASCDLFIGNNSGPLHVASALGLPTVSVMGPTDPLRFAPRGAADRVVRRDLPCSPCRRARCWHHTCLRSISPEEVLAQAEAALERLLPREEAR